MQRLLLRALVVFWLASVALPANGQDAAFYYQRGQDSSHLENYDKAIADFGEAIRLAPNDPSPYYDRAICWVLAYKNFDKAIADYSQAIRLKDPNPDLCYSGRAICWDGLGEYDKAIADVDRAIRVNPKDADIYRVRGQIRIEKREYDKAIADYEQAIRLIPKDLTNYEQIADAYEFIARIQATCPDPKYRDGKRAVVSAKKACVWTGTNDWNRLATLAAAYAESGDFDKAVDSQTKALAIEPFQQLFSDRFSDEKNKSVEVEEVAEARSRLELYKQKKPYHEEPKK